MHSPPVSNPSAAVGDVVFYMKKGRLFSDALTGASPDGETSRDLYKSPLSYIISSGSGMTNDGRDAK